MSKTKQINDDRGYTAQTCAPRLKRNELIADNAVHCVNFIMCFGVTLRMSGTIKSVNKQEIP